MTGDAIGMFYLACRGSGTLRSGRVGLLLLALVPFGACLVLPASGRLLLWLLVLAISAAATLRCLEGWRKRQT
jgi:hypothetical protein